MSSRRRKSHTFPPTPPHRCHSTVCHLSDTLVDFVFCFDRNGAVSGQDLAAVRPLSVGAAAVVGSLLLGAFAAL